MTATPERTATFTACRDPRVVAEFSKRIRRLSRDGSSQFQHHVPEVHGKATIYRLETGWLDELYRRRYNPAVALLDSYQLLCWADTLMLKERHM